MSDSEETPTTRVEDTPQPEPETTPTESSATSELRNRKPEQNESGETKKPAKSSSVSAGGIKVPTVDQLKELVKNPKEIPAKLSEALSCVTSKVLPNEPTFPVFFVSWLPFMIVGAGTIAGYLFQLVFRAFHFLIGFAAGFYVYTLIKNDKLAPTVKLDQIIMISAFIPAFIVGQGSNIIASLLILIVAAGTPFLLETHFKKQTSDKETKPEIEWKRSLLVANVAPAITFVIATGGYGYVNSILLAVLFSGSCFVTQKIVDAVKPETIINSKLPPNTQLRKEFVFAVIEVLLANTLLLVLSGFILPEFLFEEQNGFLLQLLFTLLGLGATGGAFFLLDNKDPSLEQPRQIYSMAVSASYALLLLQYVVYESFAAH